MSEQGIPPASKEFWARFESASGVRATDRLHACGVPFEQVDAAFAAAEGEGDGSLAHWQAVHWAYFGRECDRLERSPDPKTPVVCEHFRVIYSEGSQPA